ncbi:MAG: cyclic nucleotide-binding domain-containing protein [Clostridiales bacterium]|nr:cyclic nucleotide-binding domain-containing protein [Clostridiales bacterium]
MKKIANDELIIKLQKRISSTNFFPEDFIAGGEWFHVKKDEILIHQGEAPRYFYYVIEGVTQLYHFLPNGKTLTINTFKEPHILGEMELISTSLVPLQVVAKSDLTVFAVGMDEARESLMSNAVFLKNLCMLLGRKERTAIAQLAIDRGYSASVRLARFVLDNSIQNSYSVRKVDAASSLGISYRHLEKLFCDFVVDGYLEKAGGSYKIIDEQGLNMLCNEIAICEIY